jgi:hypothetical protein
MGRTAGSKFLALGAVRLRALISTRLGNSNLTFVIKQDRT